MQRSRPRISTLLSVANMRLKLGDGPLAAYLYAAILEHSLSTVVSLQEPNKQPRAKYFRTRVSSGLA